MFTQRSQEKELLDLGSYYYSSNEFTHCQQMLFRMNQFLGIFKDTKKLLKTISNKKSLIDIGCGGGLFLLNLSSHFLSTRFVGVDISTDAITIAENNLAMWKRKKPQTQVSFQLQHEDKLSFPENSFDIVLTTLVCHHLTNDELILFLKNLLHTANTAVIIHDLHRHPMAYYLYKIISPFFRNRLITHDGLISIKRSFSREDWQQLLRRANIQHYQIKWRFPFRWSVVLWKK